MKLKINRTFTGSVDAKEIFDDAEIKRIWGNNSAPSELSFNVTNGKLSMYVLGVTTNADVKTLRKTAELYKQIADAIEENE